jgi:PAS domain-containing protein
MFVLLCILVWLNEILDFPHLLLGALHTPINWREAILETVLIAGVGLFVVLRLIHDVTERKRAEEALRESEGKYRVLFETAKDAVFLTDETGKFVDRRSQGIRSILESSEWTAETSNV